MFFDWDELSRDLFGGVPGDSRFLVMFCVLYERFTYVRIDMVCRRFFRRVFIRDANLQVTRQDLRWWKIDALLGSYLGFDFTSDRSRFYDFYYSWLIVCMELPCLIFRLDRLIIVWYEGALYRFGSFYMFICRFLVLLYYGYFSVRFACILFALV